MTNIEGDEEVAIDLKNIFGEDVIPREGIEVSYVSITPSSKFDHPELEKELTGFNFIKISHLPLRKEEAEVLGLPDLNERYGEIPNPYRITILLMDSDTKDPNHKFVYKCLVTEPSNDDPIEDERKRANAYYLGLSNAIFPKLTEEEVHQQKL